MKQNLYEVITQEYLTLNSDRRKLIQERERISAKIEIVEEILIALNDILCKHGDHIYEHFEEREDKTE